MKKKLALLQKEIALTMTLVRRDYALQYAGSFLGIFWMFIQNISFILIYVFVILIFQNKTATEFYPNLFSGLLFWLPLQEMFLRGTTILSENRNLIKRSSLGLKIFINIPFYQMMIHYFFISIPVFFVLFFYSALNVSLFSLSFVLMFLCGKYVQLGISYLSKANLILKDISPVVRLTSQVFFWTLPIMYNSHNSEILSTINLFNPLNIPLDLFRYLVLNDYKIFFDPLTFVPFLLFFLGVFLLSEKKFHKIILDHL